MTCVTSGNEFTDLDSLASIVGYTELLNKLGNKAVACVLGTLNSSVTKSIKSWNLEYVTKYDAKNEFVVVDASNPDYIKQVTTIDRVVELWDHHFGYEDFWKQTLGDKTHIEKVGACATLIWEEFLRNKISPSSVTANLLYTAILSNTLNFKAGVVDKRDVVAFDQLKQYTDLPRDWSKHYFNELSEDVFSNPYNAIMSDIKTTKVQALDKPISIFQLELWDGNLFLKNNLSEIKKAFDSVSGMYSLFTCVSIDEGINYLYCTDDLLKKTLLSLIGAEFSGDFGVTTKLWLRKEILRELKPSI